MLTGGFFLRGLACVRKCVFFFSIRLSVTDNLINLCAGDSIRRKCSSEEVLDIPSNTETTLRTSMLFPCCLGCLKPTPCERGCKNCPISCERGCNEQRWIRCVRRSCRIHGEPAVCRGWHSFTIFQEIGQSHIIRRKWVPSIHRKIETLSFIHRAALCWTFSQLFPLTRRR